MSIQAGTTLQITALLAANTPVRGTTVATFRPDELGAAVSEAQIPGGEVWNITDLYISAAGDVAAGGDSVIQVEKNRFFNKYTSAPLSTLLISNPSRNGLKYNRIKLQFAQFDILRFKAVNLAAIGVGALTDTFYVDIEKIPIGR